MASAQHPDPLLWHYRQAEALANQQRFDEALREYQKVLQLDADFAEAYSGMGVIYWKTGRIDDAIEVFQKALARNNRLLQAHAVMGLLLSKRGQNTEAIAHYKQAIDIDPHLSWLHSNLAAFVTQHAGVGNRRWSLGCAFADYDNDGFVDLYVTNYIDFHFETHTNCTQKGVAAYCPPESFEGAPDTLYRNNGDGTFTDVTTIVGVYNEGGKGMGVVFGDYDNDGDIEARWPSGIVDIIRDVAPNQIITIMEGTHVR